MWRTRKFFRRLNFTKCQDLTLMYLFIAWHHMFIMGYFHNSSIKFSQQWILGMPWEWARQDNFNMTIRTKSEVPFTVDLDKPLERVKATSKVKWIWKKPISYEVIIWNRLNTFSHSRAKNFEFGIHHIDGRIVITKNFFTCRINQRYVIKRGLPNLGINQVK